MTTDFLSEPAGAGETGSRDMSVVTFHPAGGRHVLHLPAGRCSRLLFKNDVGCLLRGHVLGHPVAERRQIKTGKKRLPTAEQNRRDHDMQPVDQSRSQILPNGGHATADAHVARAGRRFRPW